MLLHLQDIEAELIALGQHFEYSLAANEGWHYNARGLELNNLPLPFDQAGVQLSNAALAITAVNCLSTALPFNPQAIRAGLSSARLQGRCQLLSPDSIRCRMVLDVSHNEASLAVLAELLKSLNVNGRFVVVCGMLQDKEIVASLAQLAALVQEWHLASINIERGASADYLNQCLHEAAAAVNPDSVYLHNDAQAAFEFARQTLTANDCLVVFGSFYVAGDIISTLKNA